MYFINMASGCIHEEALCVSLDELDNIFTLLDQDNFLKGKITHLFNEVIIFIFNFEKTPQPVRL